MPDSSFAAPLAFPFGGSVVTITTLCDVWAQDLIAVTFQEPLANDIYLQDILAYKVTPLDGGMPVDVIEVQTGNQTNTSTVWLVVTPPQIGKTYQITFQNLYAITGLVVTPNPCNFIGRATKQDAIINSRPQMYDMRPNSNLRKVLQAIGRQDDLIGGSRSDYFTSPLQSGGSTLTDIAYYVYTFVLDNTPIAYAGAYVWADPQPTTADQKIVRLLAVLLSTVFGGGPLPAASTAYLWADPQPTTEDAVIDRLASNIYATVLGSTPIP